MPIIRSRKNIRYDAYGTWAVVNAHGAKAVAYSKAFATDIGPAGTEFYSDGTYWRPINGRALLFQQLADINMSVNSSEQTIQTYNLPSGLLMPGGKLVASFGTEKLGPSTTDTLTVRVRINSNAIIALALTTTAVSLGSFASFQRQSSTSIRKVGAGAANGVNSMALASTTARGAAITTTDLDSTSNQILLTGQMTTGTAEYGSFNGYMIELVG
jgi:hypothetical protein